MPPGKPDLSGYNYGAISSLVLTADRSAIPRRDKEPDGAPESLVGRINPGDMGSRVQRQAPKDLDKKRKKAAELKDASEKQGKRRAAEAGFGYSDIIEATQDLEGLTYRPSTTQTREVYELILSTVHQAVGDQASDIVRSAADMVLEALKDESLRDFDKKKQIEEVLGSVSSDMFSQLVNLSKKITDYGADDEAAEDPDAERNERDIDEDGVAVVFDEEEQEEEEEEEGYEIREESDEEGGDDEAEKARPDDDADDELVFSAASSNVKATRTQVDEDVVPPHEIDGFWVQRQVGEVFKDPVTVTEKATEALTILGSESSPRDCENQLMELFEFQSHSLVTKFLKNRDVIVWCTKLVRSDADERVNVEVAMREKGAGWILRQLAGDRKASARADGDAMDVDERSRVQEVPKTGTLAPGSTVQPKRILDLEGMAFSQGGHLMSNKKCKLPEGSFKRSKKGYEEIHVPAPKKPAKEAQLVPITELPAWAQQAFPKVTHLNRVQSKLFPVAFGEDDPLLLCAPTGAGKVRFVVLSKTRILTVLRHLDKCRHVDFPQRIVKSSRRADRRVRSGFIQNSLHCANEGSRTGDGRQFRFPLGVLWREG